MPACRGGKKISRRKKTKGGAWRLGWKDFAALLLNPWAGVVSGINSIRESRKKEADDKEYRKLASLLGGPDAMPEIDDIDIDIVDEISNLTDQEVKQLLAKYLSADDQKILWNTDSVETVNPYSDEGGPSTMSSSFEGIEEPEQPPPTTYSPMTQLQPKKSGDTTYYY